MPVFKTSKKTHAARLHQRCAARTVQRRLSPASLEAMRLKQEETDKRLAKLVPEAAAAMAPVPTATRPV